MPEFHVGDVPIFRDLDCPRCSVSVERLRREDQSTLRRLGAKVWEDVRFFCEPCGHEVKVLVRQFGEGITLESVDAGE